MIDIVASAASHRLAVMQAKVDRLEAGVEFEPPAPRPEEPPAAVKQKATTELRNRLDSMGFRIGWSLAERFAAVWDATMNCTHDATQTQ